MKRAPNLLLVPLLALAACGGGPSDGVASAGGGASAKPHASAGTSLSRDEARLRYARCMRENGVPEYPDDPRDPRNKSMNGIRIPDRAVKACKKWESAAGFKTIDANDPETRDRFLRLARCMRAHGVDWPDPQPGSLGGPPPDLSGVPNKAKVQGALKECQRSWSPTPAP